MQTTIKDTVLQTASPNINTHNTILALEDLAKSSTQAAIQNSNSLPNWDTYTHDL